jgi:hypothetical protein
MLWLHTRKTPSLVVMAHKPRCLAYPGPWAASTLDHYERIHPMPFSLVLQDEETEQTPETPTPTPDPNAPTSDDDLDDATDEPEDADDDDDEEKDA